MWAKEQASVISNIKRSQGIPLISLFINTRGKNELSSLSSSFIIIIIQPLSIFSEGGEHTRFVLKNQPSIADSFQVVYCAQFFRLQSEIIILQGHHWANSTSSLATQRRWSLPKSGRFATIAKETEKDCCCGRRT